MATLANLVQVAVASTGTGTLTLGSAIAGYLTFAQAGVSSGATVSYSIINNNQTEVGRGVYNSAGTLTRGPLFSTNSNAAINITGSATVIVTALAEDFNDINSALAQRVRVDAAQAFTSTEKAQARTNIDARSVRQVITPAGASSAIIPIPAGNNSFRIQGVFKGSNANALVYARISCDGGATYLSTATDYLLGYIENYFTNTVATASAFYAQIIACIFNGDPILPSKFNFEIDTPNPIGGNLSKVSAVSYGVTNSGASGSQYKFEAHGFARSTARPTHVLLFTSDATNFATGTTFFAEGLQ